METSDFIEHLDHQGKALAQAAADAGEQAAVPGCPGWHTGDLLRHTGMIHRWATGFIAEGHRSPREPVEPPAGLAGSALLEWYEEGHAALVAALRAAPADVECWTFLRAPSPLAFWARRQAHETAVHRVDAEAARGAGCEDLAPEFAADGIDEILAGFHRRRSSRVRTDTPRTLRVLATDTGDEWTVRLSGEPPITTRDAPGDADCEVSGPAAGLYLALWNRRSFPSVTGDTALARLWTERSPII